MRPSLRIPVAASAAALVAAAAIGAANAGSAGSPSNFAAKLTTGKEIPKPVHVGLKATGAFHAKLSGRRLTWTLTFSGLSGPVAAIYLQYGDSKQTGAVLVAVCTECKTPARGTSTLTSADVGDLRASEIYINLETMANPRGEIRGQVVAAK